LWNTPAQAKLSLLPPPLQTPTYTSAKAQAVTFSNIKECIVIERKDMLGFSDKVVLKKRKELLFSGFFFVFLLFCGILFC